MVDAETIKLCDWLGCLLGVTGALMLASNTKLSRYGWYAFLAANVATGSFAAMTGADGLLVQQLCFSGTSLLGIYRTRQSLGLMKQSS